jgi:hypothetical protein
MAQITQKVLDSVIDNINSHLESKHVEYRLRLSYAYGKIALRRVHYKVDEIGKYWDGSVKNLTPHIYTKRTMNDLLNVLWNFI